MSAINRLKTALAAVPLKEPCSATAVAALHAAGAAAFRTLTGVDCRGEPATELLNACAQQAVPGACMPVLAWLAAGLRSSLPPAATQQAHEMACALLRLVSQAVPSETQKELEKLGPQEEPSPHLKRTATGYLKQLGTTGVLCQQLAQVVTALLATTFPGGASGNIATGKPKASTTSSSINISSSDPKVLLRQQASLALVWHEVGMLVKTSSRALGQVAAATHVSGSGLLQAMLQGSLLLLAADPAAYSAGAEQQQLLLDMLNLSHTASVFLLDVGFWLCELRRVTRAPDAILPWMRPLLKLQILLLAKMQWDVRQRPDLYVIEPKDLTKPLIPCKALTRGVTLLRSPCVAGDLLRQQAPGLLTHTRPKRRLVHARSGRRWEEVEGSLCSSSPKETGVYLNRTAKLLGTFATASVPGTVKEWSAGSLQWTGSPSVNVQELLLLLEVTELYCLACPGAGGASDPFLEGAWSAVRSGVLPILGMGVRPEDFAYPFAAAAGPALLSITEYLTEDVLLMMDGAASPVLSPATSNTTASSSSRNPRTTAGSSSAAAASAANASSSGGKAQRPTAGRRVALGIHVTWAQQVVDFLGTLFARLQQPYVPRGMADASAEVVPKLITSSTAPRLYRLLESHLRTPTLLGSNTGALSILHLLPHALPGLYAAASSPAGSAALLSAVVTATKRQRALNAALAALVQAGGASVRAAAGLVASMPGPMGQALAAQLMSQPATPVQDAYMLGNMMMNLAEFLMTRAFALLDPVLAPAAAFLARGMPPGEDSRLAGLEAAVSHVMGTNTPYRGVLAHPLYVDTITQSLRAALACQQAAPASRQAAKLAKKAGAGATEAEQLSQQLQDMWLGGGGAGAAGGRRRAEVPSSINGSSSLAAFAAKSMDARLMAAADCFDRSSTAACAPGELPFMLQMLCITGHLTRQEVLAAGDPAQWGAAVRPPTPADLHVAGTALLVACKAVGSVAQLPKLLQQAREFVGSDSWLTLSHLRTSCITVADWALLLAPLLGLILPAEQAAQLQEVAAGIQRSMDGKPPQLTESTVSHVLGLLGHVVPPGALGCSYPGCCNLEGRREADLPVQACSKCRGVRYCCREHQVAHWKAGHKEVCQAAQAAAQQVMDAATGGLDQMHNSS